MEVSACNEALGTGSGLPVLGQMEERGDAKKHDANAKKEKCFFGPRHAGELCPSLWNVKKLAPNTTSGNSEARPVRSFQKIKPPVARRGKQL